MNDLEKDSLAGEIEDGTYYVAAHRWYSEIFHTPIAERSYYIIVLVLAVLTVYFSVAALIGIFPIKPPLPFTLYGDNVWDESPHIKKLAQSSKEDKNVTVMRFMIGNYVINRESYDLKSYEFRYRNIWNNSTPAVFETYKKQIDATNPLSPYHQYTDLAKRTVEILSIDYDRGPEISHAHVVFKASVISVVTNKEIRHTKWKADLTYKYTDFKVVQRLNGKNPVAVFLGLTEDDAGGSGEKREITPMTFTVSEYQLKELLE